MERSKHFIVFVLLFLSFTNLNASHKSDIYRTYINSDMPKWGRYMNEMLLQKDKSLEFKLELINYLYGYIGYCIGHKKTDEAYKYVEICDEYVEDLKKNNYNLSMVNAYKAALYGFRIGLNIMKAPFLGRDCMNCAKMSLTLNPNNPIGIIQYANIQFYMPPIFGGSKTEALAYYIKAKEIMEKNDEYVKENWNYINLLAYVAQTHIALENLTAAKATYEYILKLEPNFVWVKYRLYPELLAMIKNKQ